MRDHAGPSRLGGLRGCTSSLSFSSSHHPSGRRVAVKRRTTKTRTMTVCPMLMGRMGSEIAPNCCLTLPFAALRIPQKIDDLPRCEHILEALCILCGLVKLVYACRPHLSAVGNPHFAALVRDLGHGVSGT